MFQISWALFQQFLTNQILTNLRLECSKPFYLSIEPLMHFLILNVKVIFLKFLLHLPLPVFSAKLISDSIFPPHPLFLTVDISDAHVPILSGIREKSAQPANYYMVKHKIVFHIHINVL